MIDFDRRLWILFAAGLLIIGAVCYRLRRDELQRQESVSNTESVSTTERTEIKPAPLFEAFNQDNKIVRLSSFIGRHEIWVIFFREPLDRDPLFQKVVDASDSALARGVKIIGITAELPQNNRKFLKALGVQEIPVLTDPEPIYDLHHRWGLVDEKSGDVRSGLFVVDRSGNKKWKNGYPASIANVDEFLKGAIEK